MTGSRQKQVDAKGSRQPSMDGVLKRMLSTPPDPKKKAKPEVKADKSKPAK